MRTPRWRQPVRDPSGMHQIRHRPDRRLPFLDALGDALMLPEVFLPGGDFELLENPSRLGAVLPRSTGTRARAAPSEPCIPQCGQQVCFAARHCDVYLPESVYAA